MTSMDAAVHSETGDGMPTQDLLYLSHDDVVSVGLTMADIIAAVEDALREKGEGRVEMPPKSGLHPAGADDVIHAQPAYLPRLKSAGIKWISGFADNPKRGLPNIAGLLILNDPETGLPISVMDCAWITAMRTGAASAIAARFLARPQSSVVGVIGCGVQGRTHVEALSVLFPLQRVMAYDAVPETARRYAHDVSGRFAVEVTPVSDPRDAVAGCDIVVTATPMLKKPRPLIEAGWMAEGTFAALVDLDSRWQPRALLEASKFCTDDLSQLRHFQSLGFLRDIPPVYAELGELASGRKRGRETATERIITCHLGMTLEDMAVAPLVHRRAVEKGIGIPLPR